MGEITQKKYGKQNGKQQYFCNICSQKFQLSQWAKPKEKKWIIEEYTEGKQTQQQIGKKLGKSREWVNKYLSQQIFFEGNYNQSLIPQKIVLIVDTTYFEQFGIMAFRAANLGENLLWYEVSHETNQKYKEGIQFLIDKGWVIEMLIADGKPGLAKLFPDILFQLCHFHLFQTVTRYISKNPKLLAGKELQKIMFELKRTDRESFEYWIKQWHLRWERFLNERTEYIGKSRKKRFVHERLRSAYFAIKRALPFLFTAHKFLPEKQFDMTTNSLDGYFSHLRSKLSVHRGASKNTQLKLISALFFL